jgi:hypothetical protein
MCSRLNCFESQHQEQTLRFHEQTYGKARHSSSRTDTRGADKSFAIIRKTTSYGIEKMYLLYIFPLSSTHLLLPFSNFFNSCKKNTIACAANRKIGNRKSKRLIGTPTYEQQYVVYSNNYCNFKNRLRHDTINATSLSNSRIDLIAVQYVSGRTHVTAVFSVGKSSVLTG